MQRRSKSTTDSSTALYVRACACVCVCVCVCECVCVCANKITKLDIRNQRVRRYFWNENASTIMLLIIAIFMVESHAENNFEGQTCGIKPNYSQKLSQSMF